MEQSQMSKFCIDLEGMMLPDAIAAVVEAWYDVQNGMQQSNWEEELRLKIKREFGRGWSVFPTNGTKVNPYGKTRLTRMSADRSRVSVVIPIEYREENAKLISSHVFQAIDLFNGTGGNLRNCIDTMEKLGTFAKSSAI
jgi:hypothetical protein